MKIYDLDKLGIRSKKYKLLRYPKESLGYYFYSSNNQKVFVNRQVTFLKKKFIQDNGSGKTIELDDVLNLINLASTNRIG